jgi:3-carboxy-cis,cis-muconate cycloisomerase
LDVEAALAMAEAEVGLFPKDAAQLIVSACQVEKIDLDELKKGSELVGYPILPLIRQISLVLGEEAGGYVHWGATTQDIMDTAAILLVQRSLDLISASLARLLSHLSDLARIHRSTVMAGRTHGQQALPITFGYKLAVFIAELRRHQARFRDLRPRLLVIELGGAAGTLASLGPVGLLVQENFAKYLGLSVPPIAWHTNRDNLAEFVACQAMMSTTIGKLATEIAFLQRTEVGEVEEGYLPGRGSSSTMPQKRNPITCEAIIGASATLRQLSSGALEFMLHDNERATGPWHTEWLVLPQACLLTDGILNNAVSLFSSLVVHPKRMRQNLTLTGGLINAEAIMMALAPIFGRQQAHELVYTASMDAVRNGTDLKTELLALPELVRILGPEDIDRLLLPDNYLGLAVEFTDRVLNEKMD